MWGQVIGAGIGLLGSMSSAKKSSREAAKNRAFQELMSSTAHQREVADLRAAGLNPILSAKLGGASSPAGSMPNIPDFGAAMAQGMNSALGWSKQPAEVANIEANTQKLIADGKLSEASAEVAKKSAEQIAQQIEIGSTDLEKARIIVDYVREHKQALITHSLGLRASALETSMSGWGMIFQNIFELGGQAVDYIQENLGNPKETLIRRHNERQQPRQIPYQE